MIGKAATKLPTGKRPRFKKLDLSTAIAVKNAAEQPITYPDSAPLTKV